MLLMFVFSLLYTYFYSPFVSDQEIGTPQGIILSVNLLFNNLVKYLNSGIDGSLYVDDFLICYRLKNIHTIEQRQHQEFC